MVLARLEQVGHVGAAPDQVLQVGLVTHEKEARNGRWGGTSTPMHLVDRVVPGPRPPYRAQDIANPQLVGVSFEELVAALGDHLFDHRTRSGRYLLYNVGPLQRFGKLAVIALAGTQAEADEAL
jgi:hypothetical protein